MPKKRPRAKLTDQVRQAIRDCGETRYRISAATGVSNETLCRFVSGERGLSMEALDIVAAYLGLSIASDRKRK